MDMLIAEASASKSSWLGLLHDDLAWLQSLAPLPDGALQDFPNGLAEWCVHDRANYRSKLRRALISVRSTLHEPEWCQSSSAHSDNRGGHHRCHKCDASFETFQALTAHLFAKHKTQCEAQEYSGSTLCRACLRQFWTRKRIVRHLQHDAPGCLRMLSSHGIEVDRDLPPPDPSLEGLPATRVSGPLLPLHVSVEDFASNAAAGDKELRSWYNTWRSPTMNRWLEAMEESCGP